MLKKIIVYEDFDGASHTETHYFHLTKAEIVKFGLSVPGGLSKHLQKLVDAEDGASIMTLMNDLILMSYGVRVEKDSTRFIKTEELRKDFASSLAFSELFSELVTDAKAAIEFVNGIIPANLKELVEQAQKNSGSDQTKTEA